MVDLYEIGDELQEGRAVLLGDGVCCASCRSFLVRWTLGDLKVITIMGYSFFHIGSGRVLSTGGTICRVSVKLGIDGVIPRTSKWNEEVLTKGTLCDTSR